MPVTKTRCGAVRNAKGGVRMPQENKKFVIVQQSGYIIDLPKLMEAAKLLMEMGYTVRRVRVQREGQKTMLNALEIQEQNPLQETIK